MSMALSPRWWRPWQRVEPPPTPQVQHEQDDAQRELRHDYLKEVHKLALTTEVARERFDRLGEAMDAIDVHLQYIQDSAHRRHDEDGPADSGGSADPGIG